MCSVYCQIAGLFPHIAKDILKVDKISNWQSKLSLTWFFMKKVFKLQQTLTSCHTGHFFSWPSSPLLSEIARSMNCTEQQHAHIYQNSWVCPHPHPYSCVWLLLSWLETSVGVLKRSVEGKNLGFQSQQSQFTTFSNQSFSSLSIFHAPPAMQFMSLLAWTFKHCNLLTFRPALLIELLRNPWLVWKSSKSGKRRELLEI